jgi:hypothetical protein
MRKDIQHIQGDLAIRNGDFVITHSDTQHVEDVVISLAGEFKSTPMIGFGAVNQLKKNTNHYKFKRDLKIQLEYDGYRNANIDLKDGYEQIKINV